MTDRGRFVHRGGEHTPGMYPPRDSAPMSRSISAVSLSRGSSAAAFGMPDPRRPFSPGPNREEANMEMQRLNRYHLNISEDDNEARRQQQSRESVFYATKTTKDVRPEQLLPYRTESIREQYRYLCHIVTHIYMAIKSLDLKSNISISVGDLDRARAELMRGVGEGDGQERGENEEKQGLDAEGERFETLMHTESEAEEDDQEEDSSDSFYESDLESEDEDASVFASTPVSKVDKQSASVISLKYWTKELKNLLTIGVAVPGRLCVSLIKVFYAVVLSRGQSVDIGFYTEVVVALMREKDVLRELGLRLDWRPIYQDLSGGLVGPNESGHVADELRMKRLVRFSLAVSSFFDPGSIGQVVELILARYSSQTISPSFVQMAVLLPVVFKRPVSGTMDTPVYEAGDIRHYLPVLFSCWATQQSSREIGSLVSVVANIAQQALAEGSRHPELVHLGKYGIFTRQQFAMLLNLLAVSCRSPADEKQSKYLKLLVDIAVHSLTARFVHSESGVLDLLRTFIGSLTTLVHPSNSGVWSTGLSRVVKRLATAYHRRLLQERVDKTLVARYADDYSGLPLQYRLSDELTAAYIDMLLPVIMLGVQSKAPGQRRRYIASLQTLCFISPHRVLDTVLLDIYSSFGSVNSTHRINVILREVTALSRYMVQLPIYRVHVPRLLSMLVPGIDSNDPDKTILTIGLVKLVCLVVPFADLSAGRGERGALALDFTARHVRYLEGEFYGGEKNKSEKSEKEKNKNEEKSEKREEKNEEKNHTDSPPPSFPYSPEEELNALKSASSAFPEFARQFCRSCFKYLEYSPDVESDDGVETRASVLIPQAFDALVESIDDSLFQIVADEFFAYVSTHVKHPVAVIFSNIAELLVRRDPAALLHKLYGYLLRQIRREIAVGAGVSRGQHVLNKDASLVWYLKLLCGVCLGAGGHLVPLLGDLLQLLTKDTVNLRGEASYSVSMLANSVFTAVSCVRPLERRLISPDWLEKHGGHVTEACWGAFQFDPYRFDASNLQFRWYQPSAAEIDPLVDGFDKVIDFSIHSIDTLLSDVERGNRLPLDTVDRLSHHVNILDGSVAGICTLFDPSFKPHTLEPAKVLSRRVGPRADWGSEYSSRSNSQSNLLPISHSNSQSNLLQSQSISALPSTASLASIVADSAEAPALPAGATFESAVTEVEDENEDDTVSDAPIDVHMPPDSATPTGASTPASLTAGAGEFESIDASLTRRSPGLYSFGYYFEGNTFTRLSDPSYVKLHAARERVGHALHRLAAAVSGTDASIDLLGEVIQAMSDWLKNCGYFSTNNPVLIDNMHLAGMLDFAGVNSPFTRSVFGARAAVYHCNRTSLSRCTRLPTATDKLLIRDLVQLAASSYAVTSYHASSVLCSALSKIMNCTYLVFGIFKEWDSALANRDQDKLRNVLRVFSLRKFRGLAEKNSHYLRRYEDLLVRSVEFDEYHTTTLASKLYGSIRKYVRVPCEVCEMNFELVESIRPPDPDVDTRIRVLKLAKDTKKKMYLGLVSRLMSRTLRRTSGHMYWKLRLSALEMVSSLQTHFEVPLSPEILKVLAKSVNGIHPALSKKCVIWIASILDVVSTKGLYKYDLGKILCVKPPEPGIVPLDSIQNGAFSNPDAFFAEMHNFRNPKFFLDSRFWVPTLCWDPHQFDVVDASFDRTSLGLGLSPADRRAVRRFGHLVSRHWVTQILQLHIQESESNTAFLPGMAYFVCSLCVLSFHGYTPNFHHEQFFDILGSLYKKDDKATHLAAAEVYAGLLLSCRVHRDHLAAIDGKIAGQLAAIIKSDISQSTVNIWKIFCWWLPAHFDMRRSPQLVHTICSFEIDRDGASSPFATFTRLTLLKAYMSSTLNTYHCFPGTIRQLFGSLSHPYHIVADRVASLLFDCLLYTSTRTFSAFSGLLEANIKVPGGRGIYPYAMDTTFDACLSEYMDKIHKLRPTVDGKGPQEIASSDYMYAVRGLHFFVLYALKTSHGDLLYPYLKSHIIPLILDLDNMKDACKLLNINTTLTLYLIASTRYTDPEIAEISDALCNRPIIANPSLSQSLQLVSLTQAFYMVRFLVLSDSQRDMFANRCISFLYDEHLEVRERASAFFTLLVHSYPASHEEIFIHGCIKRFRRLIKAYRRQLKHDRHMKPSTSQISQLHGATLGLGSLIEAFPYTTPPPRWMPKVLSTLANKCSSIDGIVGRTAKDILSKFKKTRQDTWHIDSKFFTPEQLEDLEGVLWKSYFI
ncbi:hypothetical protein HII13_004240 [Brettanomyces bruxellensis]|nr:hypothetical protein HII13_004240 [Brettanomyces bruxellensis]